jgi:hypothetical protein
MPLCTTRILVRYMIGFCAPTDCWVKESCEHSGLQTERRRSLSDIHYNRLDESTWDWERKTYSTEQGADKGFEKNVLGGKE